MAMKARSKTGAKATRSATQKTEVKEQVSPALGKMTTVSFRTRQLQKKKAEKIFDDMGISMSGAINMFLAQVVREKGMPFTPTAQKREPYGQARDEMGTEGYVALEELWEEL